LERGRALCGVHLVLIDNSVSLMSLVDLPDARIRAAETPSLMQFKIYP